MDNHDVKKKTYCFANSEKSVNNLRRGNQQWLVENKIAPRENGLRNYKNCYKAFITILECDIRYVRYQVLDTAVYSL